MREWLLDRLVLLVLTVLVVAVSVFVIVEFWPW